MDNELEMRAGDFGWIVSADALRRDVTTLRDITAVLRFGAWEEREERAAWRPPTRPEGDPAR